FHVTGVQTCALPLSAETTRSPPMHRRNLSRHATSAAKADALRLRQLPRWGTTHGMDSWMTRVDEMPIVPDLTPWVGGVTYVSVEIGRASCRERVAIA